MFTARIRSRKVLVFQLSAILDAWDVSVGFCPLSARIKFDLRAKVLISSTRLLIEGNRVLFHPRGCPVTVIFPNRNRMIQRSHGFRIIIIQLECKIVPSRKTRVGKHKNDGNERSFIFQNSKWHKNESFSKEDEFHRTIINI